MGTYFTYVSVKYSFKREKEGVKIKPLEGKVHVKKMYSKEEDVIERGKEEGTKGRVRMKKRGRKE